MPQFNRADRTDARGSQMNDIGGSQHNYSQGSTHNSRKVSRHYHSTNKRNKNTYSTTTSKDKSWRSTYNMGSTYYTGFNSGSIISGDMNNVFTSGPFSPHRGMATDIGEPNATSYEVPISSRSQTDSIPFHQLGAHNHMQYMAHAPKGTAQNDILSQPEINPPEGDDEGPPNILPSGETLVPCVDHRESGEKFDADLQKLQNMGFTNTAQNIRMLQAAGGDINSVVKSLVAGIQ